MNTVHKPQNCSRVSAEDGVTLWGCFYRSLHLSAIYPFHPNPQWLILLPPLCFTSTYTHTHTHTHQTHTHTLAGQFDQRSDGSLTDNYSEQHTHTHTHTHTQDQSSVSPCVGSCCPLVSTLFSDLVICVWFYVFETINQSPLSPPVCVCVCVC